MALEMAQYGRKLSEMFQFRGDYPFEEPYVDYAIYLRALLGEEVDSAIGHFRRKAENPEYPGDTSGAEVLIGLLVRLDRFDEAIQTSRELAPEAAPTPLQLCQLAADYRQMRAIAEEKGDRVSFVAGIVQGQSQKGV
jgi:hypothetical protein